MNEMVRIIIEEYEDYPVYNFLSVDEDWSLVTSSDRIVEVNSQTLARFKVIKEMYINYQKELKNLMESSDLKPTDYE